MKLSWLLMVTAILIAFFGVGFLLLPAFFMSLYGATLDSSAESLVRLFGAALVGIATVNYMARYSPICDALRAILMGDWVAMCLGLVVGVVQIFSGSPNWFFWLTFAGYLALTVGFGYFVFTRPKQG